MFGAGTVQWDWGLDSHHDGLAANGSVPPPDPAIRQATVNLLADMRAQASTLLPGLAQASESGDHAPPASTLTVPPHNLLTKKGGYVTISGTAADSGGGRVAGVEVSIDGGGTWFEVTGRENWSYTWAPASYGTINVQVRATDDSCNTETPRPAIPLAIVPRCAAPPTHRQTPATDSPAVAAYDLPPGAGPNHSPFGGRKDDVLFPDAADLLG